MLIMGREERETKNNQLEDEKDAESSSMDLGSINSRGENDISQATLDGDLDSVETSQQPASNDGSGISIRDRLQTESSGGVFTNKDLVRSDTIIDEDRIVGRDEQLGRVVDNLKPVLQGEGIRSR